MSDLDAAHAHIQAGDLLAYLDGAASPALAQHIAACPICRADLLRLQASEALLSATLWRADCPTPDQLLAYANDLLDAAEATDIQVHLDTCAFCPDDLALIRNPPLPELLDQLRRSGARLIQAALQPMPSAIPALRGGEARRTTYIAESYQVVLASTPPALPAGAAQLEGQLIGADALLASGEGLVRLLRNEQELLREPIDDLGFFVFESVPPGVYSLALSLDDTLLLIADVAVGSFGATGSTDRL